MGALAAAVLLVSQWAGAKAGELVGKPEVAVHFGPKQTIEFKVRAMSGPTVRVDEEGFLHVAWMEEDQDIRTVRYAKSQKPQGTLGEPVRVNGTEEVPYWRQEAPALAVTDTAVFVAWARAHPQATPEKLGTELRLSRSVDGGRSFLPSVKINDDDQAVLHSFDALHLARDGVLHVSWIDAREGRKNPSTFYARSINGGRSFGGNLKLDDNTCVCCRTALATAPDGTVYVAWRKIFPGDIRETVVARSDDGGQTFGEPVIVGDDRWVYPSCPHRPASIGVDGRGRLYIVWYTEGPDDTPAVYFTYSDDRGRTFAPKRMMNRSKGTFPDHPQLAVDPDGRVVLLWEELSPVRQEIVMSVSLDRGQTFSPPVRLNDKKGQSPSVSVNRKGLVAMAWKEHAMAGHRLVLQTAQLLPPREGAGEP
jgi:hypothetical protein